MITEIIRAEKINFYYHRGTALETKALDEINFRLDQGEALALLGKTGSGKSTLLEHLNGLLPLQEGGLYVAGYDLSDPDLHLKELRSKVGFLFQQAGDQVFSEYITDDIAFGPGEYGLTEVEIKKRVRTAMEQVGLDVERYKKRRTADLSGGERRKVALAGVLAMQPEILILDEPGAGLDPLSKQELINLLSGLKQKGTSLVFAEHDMEMVAALADRVFILENASTVFFGRRDEAFGFLEDKEAYGLFAPAYYRLLRSLIRKGMPGLPSPPSNEDDAVRAIVKSLKSGSNHSAREQI